MPLSSNLLIPSSVQSDFFLKVLLKVRQSCCGGGELLPSGTVQLQKGHFQFPYIHFSFKTSFWYLEASHSTLNTQHSWRLWHDLPQLKLEWELRDQSPRSAKPLQCSKLLCRLGIGWGICFKPNTAFKYFTSVCSKPMDCECAGCIVVCFFPMLYDKQKKKKKKVTDFKVRSMNCC